MKVVFSKLPIFGIPERHADVYTTIFYETSSSSIQKGNSYKLALNISKDLNQYFLTNIPILVVIVNITKIYQCRFLLFPFILRNNYLAIVSTHIRIIIVFRLRSTMRLEYFIDLNVI